MTATAMVLLSYGLLAAFFAVFLTSYRAFFILVKGRQANTFKPDAEGERPFLKRLTRVYANYYESAPYILSVLIVSITAGFQNITDSLAYVLLASRMMQSFIHLVSVSEMAVRVRYAFFLVQIGIVVYWSYLFIGLTLPI